MPRPRAGATCSGSPCRCPLLCAAGAASPTRATRSRRFTALRGVDLQGLPEPTDFDRDGYSRFFAARDPRRSTGAPSLALDVPGNGIDEDGYGGDFRFAGGAAEPRRRRRIAGPQAHVVLIVLESTRADAIGRRVDGRPLTPELERARRARAARRARPTAMSASPPSRCRACSPARWRRGRRPPSLVRDFLANGYRVGVFSGQAEDFGGISATVGMRRDADSSSTPTR